MREDQWNGNFNIFYFGMSMLKHSEGGELDNIVGQVDKGWGPGSKYEK